jgi:hypothetical protein
MVIILSLAAASSSGRNSSSDDELQKLPPDVFESVPSSHDTAVDA